MLHVSHVAYSPYDIRHYITHNYVEHSCWGRKANSYLKSWRSNAIIVCEPGERRHSWRRRGEQLALRHIGQRWKETLWLYVSFMCREAPLMSTFVYDEMNLSGCSCVRGSSWSKLIVRILIKKSKWRLRSDSWRFSHLVSPLLIDIRYSGGLEEPTVRSAGSALLSDQSKRFAFQFPIQCLLHK